MIDIHTHILPGIDDGAADLYDSLEMLKIAAKNGVKGIVATPHCNVPRIYRNYFGEHYIETFSMLDEVVKEEKIPITLYAGMEVYVTEDLPEILRQEKILTINGSHYILVEFAFDEDPDFVDRMLAKIKELGLRPIIAHPERYEFVQAIPEMIYDWRTKGYLTQVNKGSLQGRFGKKCYKMAHEMLERRLISVIASDAHSPYKRTPHLRDVYDSLAQNYSENYLKVLFEENPRRICADKPTLKFAMRSFDD